MHLKRIHEHIAISVISIWGHHSHNIRRWRLQCTLFFIEILRYPFKFKHLRIFRVAMLLIVSPIIFDMHKNAGIGLVFIAFLYDSEMLR